jgi:hypothetical protein
VDSCLGACSHDKMHIFSWLSGVLTLALVQWLLAIWIKTRLSESIKAEYGRQLEDYKNQIKIREQAARVAELFALHYGHKPDPERLNRLIWELSLWLDAPLVCEITKCLVGVKHSKTPKEILIEVRKVLLQNPNDTLLPENIAHVLDPRGNAGLTGDNLKNPIARDLTRE